MKSSNSWRTKLWSSISLCQSRSKYARKEQRREEKQSEENKGQQLSLLSHFWSTYWSPFSTFYIPFQSSGSKESNASNGARFGVETKELQPLQADHSKVLRNQPFVARISQPFCTVLWISLEVSRRNGSQTPQDESQLRSGARITFCCEVISRPFLDVCEISQTSFSLAKWFLELPDIFAPTLLDIFLQIFVSKFPFSPCIQPLM